MTFAEQIKELRQKANWSQKDVADRLGIAQSSYHLTESGASEITMLKAVHLARALEVPPQTLGIHLSREEIRGYLSRPWPKSKGAAKGAAKAAARTVKRPARARSRSKAA